MYKIFNYPKKILLIFIISILYSLFLTFYFPIDDSIIDRGNYINYAENSSIILDRYLNKSVIALFFNEPIWLLINIFLSFFLSPENILRFIIFFSSFTISFLILRNNIQYFWFLLIILIFPNVIKNFIVHIRQGLGIAFFLIGWFSLSKGKKYFFFTLSLFIHTSFFLVIAIYFMTFILEKMKLTFYIRLIIYLILGIFISFGLGPIANVLEMRQLNEYQFIVANSSGLGFLFWFIILFVYILNGKEFLKKNSFILGMIVLYLTTYFFVEVTARIFESAIILVLLASFKVDNKYKIITMFLFIVMIVYQYLNNIGKPYIGYGLM